jgi:branched-chain amino acid transport system permease protein
MSGEPPVDQERESSAPKRSLFRRYQDALERNKAARSKAYGTARRAVGKNLQPVTRRWALLRAKVDDHKRWAYPLIGVILIAIAAMMPFISQWFTVPLWLARATNGSVLARTALFVLFALGLNVVVGFAGLLDLGYVAFWAIGAYTAGIATGAHAYIEGGSVGAQPTWHLWMWAILLLVLVVATLAGLLLGSPTLRLRGDYLAIVTLGFGEIIRIVANNLDHVTGGPRGIRDIPHPEIHVGGLNIVWGTLIDTKYYWLLLTLVVLWIVAIKMLDNSRMGRAWVAIREDELAAASMGVNIVRMKLAAFAIGACTAGVGGVIYAEQVNFISPPTFTIQQSILILAMVVIGGMGSVGGAILGASAVVLLPEIFRGFEDYRFFAFGLAIVLVMVFRPQGLLPSKRRKAELLGSEQDVQVYRAAGESA